MLTHLLTGTLTEILEKLPALLQAEPNLNEDSLRLDLLDKYPSLGAWCLSPNKDYCNLPLSLEPYLPHTHHQTNSEAQLSLRKALISWAKDQLQPVPIADIIAGDIVRAEWSYLESGTKVRVEGEVTAVDTEVVWIKTFAADDEGEPNWEIYANQSLDNSTSAATYYMIKKAPPRPESPITLLRTLPLNSLVEVHVEAPYEHESYTLVGNLKRRTESEEPTGFQYEILGKYTGTKGTVIDKMTLRITEKKIQKLFILPSPDPTNKAACTS